MVIVSAIGLLQLILLLSRDPFISTPLHVFGIYVDMHLYRKVTFVSICFRFDVGYCWLAATVSLACSPLPPPCTTCVIKARS
jgi:hypothetical protein